MDSDLGRLRYCFWLGGLALIALYLGAIGWAAGTWLPLVFLLLYGWPPLTIGMLAAVQRFIYGKPTKRTPGELIGRLPWFERDSFPYWLRHLLRRQRSLDEEKVEIFGAGPGWPARAVTRVVAFLPLIIGMLLPLIAAYGCLEGLLPPWQSLLKEYWGAVLPMIAIFFAHLLMFIVSEFLAHWRALADEATR